MVTLADSGDWMTLGITSEKKVKKKRQKKKKEV